jgi:hypothetical protein
MFAVKTRPSDRKLRASTRPVTAVITSRASRITLSAVGLLAMNNYPTEYIAMLIAGSPSKRLYRSMIAF